MMKKLARGLLIPISILACPVVLNAEVKDSILAQGGPVQDATEVMSYWTPDRMKAAEYVDAAYNYKPQEPVITPGGDTYGFAPLPTPYQDKVSSRVTGMLFFHRATDGMDAHCSASIITSQSKSLVITGAHCVMTPLFTPEKLSWYNQLMFVPAYNGAAQGDEKAPFGYWPVKQIFIPQKVFDSPWSFMGEGSVDMALGTVFPQHGRLLEEAAGKGLSPHFLQDSETFDWVTSYGYPGPSESGHGDGRQYRCDSRAGTGGASDLSEDKLTMPSCAPLGGSSGGPILLERVVGEDPKLIGTVTAPNGNNRLKESVFSPLYNAADAAH